MILFLHKHLWTPPLVIMNGNVMAEGWRQTAWESGSEVSTFKGFLMHQKTQWCTSKISLLFSHAHTNICMPAHDILHLKRTAQLIKKKTVRVKNSMSHWIWDNWLAVYAMSTGCQRTEAQQLGLKIEKKEEMSGGCSSVLPVNFSELLTAVFALSSVLSRLF